MPVNKNPAEDLPPLSVQDTPYKHTGALCPADGTLVTCSGPRNARMLVGSCPVCKRGVYARADLVSSTGSFEMPSQEYLGSLPDDDVPREDFPQAGTPLPDPALKREKDDEHGESGTKQ